jgi:hypothetical protein
LEFTIASELRNGYGPFEKDLYGTGSFLGAKRKDRRWEEETLHKLSNGLEEVVQQLLRWDGGESKVEIFPQKLPWEQ